jgi:hypothetical protein
LACVFFALFLLSGAVARAAGPSVPTAFFYGSPIPPELLEEYQRVVVEADNLPVLPAGKATLFAYVSVGEVNRSRPYYREVPRHLVIGKNERFDSDIVDSSRAEWSEFVLSRVIEPLYGRGFRGVFLDTLDSFERVPQAKDRADLHWRQLADLVEKLKKRHPDVAILQNRGFGMLPLLRPGSIDGLAVESLFETADGGGKNYRSVRKEETAQLLRKLREAQANLRLPITVIDYVSPRDAALRRRTAERILAEGFDPWVTVPSLDAIGVGAVEIVPRSVLLLYRGERSGFLGEHDAGVLIAPVLEWLGYRVEYQNVAGPLPSGSLVGRYAGIVTLLPNGVEAEGPYRKWIGAQLDAGMRIAFVEGFGFNPDPRFLARLGLAPAKAVATAPVRIAVASPLVGFEAQPRAHLRDLPPVKADDASSRLRLEDADKERWDPVVVGPWGGVAFSPYVLQEGLNEERRWILDPFGFLTDALALPAIPVPDVTTESGRRIMTVHVDGDAFVSRAERGGVFTAEVILNEILRRYRIPHTVSVVEGEVGPQGPYAKDSARFEELARTIFALEHVEIASHTFSHPFEWQEAEKGAIGPPLPFLPIPGYKFDLEREIKGSIEYINSRLAPPNKRTKLLLWSGNCAPSARAVAMTEALGILNVNGGGATRTKDYPSLTRGSAMGIPKENGAYQVFAPIENENVFTNDWRGPFYGFRKAIQTFELTDAPRRLAPLSIYYHFYSGEKTAALVALKDVYDWAMKQDTTPLFLSEYAKKVLSFQKVTLRRRVQDGAWEIDGLGAIQTVRLPSSWTMLDLERSEGVAGVRELPQGRYATLTSEGRAVLVSSSSPPHTPYLVHANGRVVRWERVKDKDAVNIRIAGNVPLSVTVAATKACLLRTATTTFRAARTGELQTFSLAPNRTVEGTLDCR